MLGVTTRVCYTLARSLVSSRTNGQRWLSSTARYPQPVVRAPREDSERRVSLSLSRSLFRAQAEGLGRLPSGGAACPLKETPLPRRVGCGRDIETVLTSCILHERCRLGLRVMTPAHVARPRSPWYSDPHARVPYITGYRAAQHWRRRLGRVGGSRLSVGSWAPRVASGCTLGSHGVGQRIGLRLGKLVSEACSQGLYHHASRPFRTDPGFAGLTLFAFPFERQPGLLSFVVALRTNHDGASDNNNQKNRQQAPSA